MGTAGRDFELRWRLGIRSSTLLAEIATRFACTITLGRGDKEANAKSIFALLSLGPEAGERGLRAGERIRVEACGEDAQAAIVAVSELLTAGPVMTQCPTSGCASAPGLVDWTATTLTFACHAGHTCVVDRTALE